MATAFQEKIQLIFETYGAKDVEKQINKMKLGIISASKATAKYGLKYQNVRYLEKEIGLRKQIVAQKKEEKVRTDMQMKADKFRESQMLKEFAQADRLIKKKQKDIKKEEKLRIKAEKNVTDSNLKERKRFKAEYLSVMFAGMALQRAFGGLFKSMITDYKEFTKGSVTPLSESLTRLEANWKFLKFAMVEAGSKELRWLADSFAGMAKAMSKMPDWVLKGLVAVIGAGAIAGTGMTAFGQGALFFSSMGNVAANKEGLNNINNTLRKMNGQDPVALKAGTDWLKAFSRAAGVGAIVIAVSDAVEATSDFSNKRFADGIINVIQTGLIGAGGITMIAGNPAVGAPLILIGLGLKLIEGDAKLGKALGGIFGTLNGLGAGLTGVMAVMHARIARSLKSHPLAAIAFGLIMPHMLPAIILALALPSNNELADTSLSSAFMKGVNGGAGFEEVFQKFYLEGDKMDDGINKLKTKFDKMADGAIEGMNVKIDDGTIKTGELKLSTNDIALAWQDNVIPQLDKTNDLYDQQIAKLKEINRLSRAASGSSSSSGGNGLKDFYEEMHKPEQSVNPFIPQ